MFRSRTLPLSWPLSSPEFKIAVTSWPRTTLLRRRVFMICRGPFLCRQLTSCEGPFRLDPDAGNLGGRGWGSRQWHWRYWPQRWAVAGVAGEQISRLSSRGLVGSFLLREDIKCAASGRRRRSWQRIQPQEGVPCPTSFWLSYWVVNIELITGLSLVCLLIFPNLVWEI